MKYCPKCGRENVDNAKFCVGCGTEFKTEETFFDTIPEKSYASPFKKESTLDTVSMILGIISLALLCICCCFPISIIVGPIGIVLAIIYLVKYPYKSKKKAIAGLIMSILAVVISVVLYVSLPSLLEMLAEYGQEICEIDPDSEDCKLFKDIFPNIF